MKLALAVASTMLVIGCTANGPIQDDLGYSVVNNTQSESRDELILRLKSDPTIEFRTSNGWQIAVSEAKRVTYRFTPKSHPAHPSHVKQEVVLVDGSLVLRTNASCKAEKSVCDQLMRDFVKFSRGVEDRFKH